ncbi:protein kinase domain-containing protein [Streptomyces sp. 184]|uniref:serine/threonine-protein kinase n=1 Tax=Streptomyces sp. 184 TaxID=1827526 RepID=UPI00389142F0
MPLSSDDPQSIGGYELIDRLGVGGMGTVYLARAQSGRQLAIKVVHQQFAEDYEFRTRFRREVAAARRVSGAYTAPVIDADPAANRPWMATLYVPGLTLAKRVAIHAPLAGRELRTLAVGLVEALRDIHATGLIHRDLKPDNVLLTDDGPRVIDFGISRAADHQTLTVTGRVLGTPPYMSPEQLRRPHRVTPASDVFSLGSVLVYALTGRGPFDSDSPYLTAYRVVYEPPEVGVLSGTVREIVQWCLAKEPGERPKPLELLEAFRATPAGDWGPHPTMTSPVRAEPSSSDPAAEPRSAFRVLRRRPGVLAASAIVVACGVIVAAALAFPDRDTKPPASDTAVQHADTPASWQPWRRTWDQRGGPPTCLTQGDSLFCSPADATAKPVRLEAASGRLVWQAAKPVAGGHHNTNTTGVVAASPTAVAAFASDNSRDGIEEQLAGYDAATGRRLWQATWHTPEHVNAVVQDMMVHPLGYTAIVGRDMRTGKIAWRWKHPHDTSSCSIQAHSTVVYLACPDANDKTRVAALRAADGQQLWTFSSSRDLKLLRVTDEGPVLIEEEDNAIAREVRSIGVLDPDTRELDLQPVEADLLLHPPDGGFGLLCAMAPGEPMLYGIGADSRIYAVDARSGHTRWQRTASIDAATAPVVSHEGVYVLATTGRVAALDRTSGRQRWATGVPKGVAFGSYETRQMIVIGDALYVPLQGALLSLDTRDPSRKPAATT